MEKDFTILSSYYPSIEKLTDLICKNKINEAKIMAETEKEKGISYRKIMSEWCGFEPEVFFNICENIGQSLLSGLSNFTERIKIVTESKLYSGRLFYSSDDTQFGKCVITLTEYGVCGIDFSEDEEKTISAKIKNWPGCIPEKSTVRVHEVRNQIFGTHPQSNDKKNKIGVHLIGTEFQVMVWKTIARIPERGKISYSEIATNIGKPNAARAVGNSVGNNPLGYLIPCHRVLPKSGALGGFSGGPAKKLAMLVYETARA